MATELRIERIETPTDAARLLVGELEAGLAANYPAEQRHGLTLAALFKPEIHFLVAQCDGVPSGCGGVALRGDIAELKRMYVRPAFRGAGVATALLARLEQFAREAGYAELTLETGTLQHAALRFYRREGFAECAAFGDYTRMPPEAVVGSVFMRKKLRPPS